MLYQNSAKHEPVPQGINLVIAVSVIGFLITGIQSSLIFFRGDAFCLNEGCEIVESLTVVPPIFFNLAGAIYFLLVLRCFSRGLSGSKLWLGAGRLLLLAGLAAEGVLVPYQHYVAQTFCSYCLVIFSLICLMTIFCGLRQVAAGLFVFGAVVTAFSSLQFSPAGMSQEVVLDEGTYARLDGDEQGGKMYLFYSATCVHCEEVIGSLEDEFQCGLRFNPIGEVEAAPLRGAERTAAYSPEVNTRYLKNLGIGSIPVLVAENGGETRILRGKSLILQYLDSSCRADTAPEEVIPQSTALSGQSSQESPGLYYPPPAEEESCGVEVECEDDLEKQGE